VVQYLSDEWMDEAGVALAAAPGLRDVAGDEPVVLQYEVAAAPGGKRSYALRFERGAVAIEPGPHKDASASFALDYDVAAEIARGDLSAQAAFMQGRLKLGGDVMVLVRHHALFDGLEDALGELRGRTEY
jgi:putative sterol carrier protein